MDSFRDQVKKGLNPRTYVLVGFLVAVLVWIHSLDVKQKALRAKNPAATIAPAPALPAAARLAERGDTRRAPTPPGWGGDPFARRSADWNDKGAPVRVAVRTEALPAQTGLYLQGIMLGPMGRTALINGDIYREGQRIGTREVLQIGKRAVMILDHGTVTTLMLKGEGS
ncbi:MAG TPA: hypothetical protein VK527_10415 [Candidatus Limnocylindrales bacterium]|nr:hypothetical protein [Candidatus Limnocylindrales bacterium]